MVNSARYTGSGRWLSLGLLALAIALSLSLFLPVQLIASAIASINMGQVGFAYLALLVLGGLFLLGLLILSSIVLRVIGWIGFCRISRVYCIQLIVVLVAEPFALLVAIVQLITFNGNLSLTIASMWLFVLIEVLGVYMLAAKLMGPRRAQHLALVSSVLGYTFSSLLVVIVAVSRSILASLLSHLAASALASLSLAVLGTTFLLTTREAAATGSVEASSGEESIRSRPS